MIKEIKLLLDQQEKLLECIRPIEEQMAKIEDRIDEIRNNCSHQSIKTQDFEFDNYTFIISECEDCGQEWTE